MTTASFSGDCQHVAPQKAYNCSQFPTSAAPGHTRAQEARDGLPTIPRAPVETPLPPALTTAPWKGDAPRNRPFRVRVTFLAELGIEHLVLARSTGCPAFPALFAGACGSSVHGCPDRQIRP